MERRSIDPSAARTSAARTNMARTSTTRMSAADTNDALMHDRDTNDSIGREDSLGIGVDLRIGGDR